MYAGISLGLLILTLTIPHYVFIYAFVKLEYTHVRRGGKRENIIDRAFKNLKLNQRLIFSISYLLPFFSAFTEESNEAICSNRHQLNIRHLLKVITPGVEQTSRNFVKDSKAVEI